MTQNGVSVGVAEGALTRAQAEQALGGKNATYYDGTVTHGMKGTVIPSSSGEAGGSLGFDPHKPMAMVIDPDIDGRSAKVVQPGAVRQQQEDKQGIAPTGYDKDEKLREQAYERMMGSLQDELAAENEQPAPAPAASSPVPEKLPEKLAEKLSEQACQGSCCSSKVPGAPEAPARKIVFELGPMGQFDCYYHRIFHDGMYLVLVWDNRWQGARYTPPQGKKDAINVVVGQERDRFTVYVGPQFTDPERNEDVLVLLIEEQRG